MTAHWGVEDPAAADGDEDVRRRAFRTAFMYLSNRVRIFANLPIDKLDTLSLQREIDAIGKAQPR
jgi:arsenate reductase